MSAQPERIRNTSFKNSSASAQYNARALAVQAVPERTTIRQKPGKKKRSGFRTQILSRYWAQLAIVLNTVIVLGVVAGIAIAFLSGHIKLANEASRSKAINQRLFQARERSYFLQHARAKTITPSNVGKKADGQGMERPEDRYTIALD